MAGTTTTGTVGVMGGASLFWVDPVANFASLPVPPIGGDGTCAITKDTNKLYTYDAGGGGWIEIGGGAPPGTGNIEDALLTFAFNTPSPAVIAALAVGDIIDECEVMIETVFDDPAATLSVGTAANPALILPSASIDVTTADTYATEDNFEIAGPVNAILTIAPGASTQGAGYILMKIRRV